MNIIDKLTARPSVYLCGPIVGRSYQEATEWRGYAKDWLTKDNITVYDPTRFEHYNVDDGLKITSSGSAYRSTGIETKGYVARDRLDVARCDLVLANFLDAETASIGSVIEIAWADMLRKPIVIVIEPQPVTLSATNPHYHEFLMELIPFRADSLDSALDLVEAILLP